MKREAFIAMVVFISLVLAGPLNARGPGGEKNNTSTSILSDNEITHVTYLREEEKLARDVYLTLNELYQDQAFANISQSEQRHMNAVGGLVEKHGIEDPVKNDTVGTFTNPSFTELYVDLVKRGELDYCSALQVGIDIETLDIEDIEVALNDVNAQDVSRVFNNLLNGSYNHLNAFTTRYEAAGCH
jgi:hypothetical protein